MVLMRKGNASEYVPDAFVDDYRKNGYKVDGDNDAAVNGGIDPNAEPKTNDNGDGENEDCAAGDADPDCDSKTGKFICLHCGKEYAKQANLDKHIAEKHAE